MGPLWQKPPSRSPAEIGPQAEPLPCRHGPCRTGSAAGILIRVTAEAPPLLTETEFEQLALARRAGAPSVECSLDLKLSETRIEIGASDWAWRGRRYPYPDRWRPRAVYYWDNGAFRPVARYSSSLIKLVPTEWGAPTFEIDGIKMLPTARVSPYTGCREQGGVDPAAGENDIGHLRGSRYFAAWCVRGHARRVCSYEKNPDVVWLRDVNPWSPAVGGVLQLEQADVTAAVATSKTAPSTRSCTIRRVLAQPENFTRGRSTASSPAY